MKKLAIITTHPIQYNAPLFKLLQERNNIQVKVFYTWGEDVLKDKFDPGFKKIIKWDIPLLEGYDFTFPENVAKRKGSGHFSGIDNPSLVKDVQAWNADAILVYGWSFKSHLKLLRFFKGKIPVFFRGDSTRRSENSGLKKMARAFFLRWLYRYIDKAFYVGSDNKEYYEAYGLKPAQLVFAPHAIDNSRFSHDADAIEKMAREKRQALGIKDDKIVFVFAGKLEPVKNPELIIAAAKEFEKENIHFILVGNGVNEKELRASAGPNISFVDFQNQQAMPVVYRMGDIFLLPSRSETWGLSINEAMACGRAVIASNACGAARDLIDEGNNGYIFQSEDKDCLCRKISAIISGGNEKLDHMKAASLKKITGWSYLQTAEALEKACSELDKNN